MQKYRDKPIYFSRALLNLALLPRAFLAVSTRHRSKQSINYLMYLAGLMNNLSTVSLSTVGLCR